MFEKIEEIFINLKERLTSPLFSSFLIAWLVTNWKIVIGIFFIDADNIRASGYLNLIDFIFQNSNWIKCFAVPFGFSLAYTFGYPYVKNYISAFLTRRNKEAEEKNLEILKDSYIPMDRFLKLREEYRTSNATLQKIITEESSSLNDITQLNTEINQLRIYTNEKQAKVNELEKNLNEINNKYNEIVINAMTTENNLKKSKETHIEDQQLLEAVTKENKKFEKSIVKLTDEKIELEKKIPLIDKYSPSSQVIFELYFTFPYDVFKKIFQIENPASVINQINDFDIKRYYSINKGSSNAFSHAIDYKCEPINIQAGVIEFIFRAKDDYALYTKLRMDNSEKDYWFCHKLDQKKFEANADNAPFEYMIPLESRELKDNWYCAQYQLREAINNSFRSYQVKGITGFRIRGAVDIARIRIYNQDKISMPPKRVGTITKL